MAPSSYEEVTAILAQCRISHFRQAFLDNECDDSFLDIVEDGDLRELGLPLGPRVRLLKAVVLDDDESRLEVRHDGGLVRDGRLAAFY